MKNMKDYYLGEAVRAINNLFYFATIKEADATYHNYKVILGSDQDGKEVVSEFIPMLVSKAGKDVDFKRYDVGERVLVMAPCANPNLGFIMGALPKQDAPNDFNGRKMTFEDGAVISYDKKEKIATLELPAGSKIKIKGSDITIEADNVTIEKAKKVTVKSEKVYLASAPEEDPTEGVVTGQCICAFTGGPHPDKSSKVLAGKA
jgi:phage baseplate assembly protein V